MPGPRASTSYVSRLTSHGSVTRRLATLIHVIDLESLADPGTFERQLAEEIDLARLPRHIAVIMDGNGRWAK